MDKARKDKQQSLKLEKFWRLPQFLLRFGKELIELSYLCPPSYYTCLHMLQLLQKNGYWGKLTFALTQVLGILILGRSNHCWRRRNPSIFFTQRAFLINSEQKRYTSKVGSSRWLNFKLLLQAALHSFPVKIWRHEIFFLLQQNVWISMVTKTDLPGKKLSFNRVEQLSVQHTPQCKQASQTRGRTH